MNAAVVREFRDDDEGYSAWLAANSDGYVVNILRWHSANTARVHRADCWTISREQPARGATWTGEYVKICATYLADLDQWATDHVGQSITRCGTCRPADSPSSRPKPSVTVQPPPMPESRWEVHGPTTESAVVEAWANDYVRFENGPDWQKDLRKKIRGSCRQLEPSDGQVLHATYFGDKRQNADVENLVLYNMHDSFAGAGRNGICFEHGAAVPLTPGDTRYSYGYRYRLAPPSETFDYWQIGRTLASFEWTDLVALRGEKKLAQVWLANARGQVALCAPAEPEAPFAVRLRVRPPRRVEPSWGGLVKGIFDGVMCAPPRAH